MLSARKLYVPILRLDEYSAIKCNVVYNLFKGNIEEHNIYTWDEPPEYDDVEIVDVFDAEPLSDGYSLLEFMSDKEVEYLKDLIVASIEDERISGV